MCVPVTEYTGTLCMLPWPDIRVFRNAGTLCTLSWPGSKCFITPVPCVHSPDLGPSVSVHRHAAGLANSAGDRYHHGVLCGASAAARGRRRGGISRTPEPAGWVDRWRTDPPRRADRQNQGPSAAVITTATPSAPVRASRHSSYRRRSDAWSSWPNQTFTSDRLQLLKRWNVKLFELFRHLIKKAY